MLPAAKGAVYESANKLFEKRTKFNDWSNGTGRRNLEDLPWVTS